MTYERARKYLVTAALLYLGFVIYGSLVPLQFRPIPLFEAWETFRAIPYLRLGIGSRADWVANILLFIPLAFLFTGVVDTSTSVAARILAAASVLAGCIALSAGIEFLQIFFPPRTVSLNDIIAEGIGTILGMIAWVIGGRRTVAWLWEWRKQQGATGLAGRFFLSYLLLVFGYNLLPLDLTLSPVEIFHKWREGRVLLLPGLRGGEGPLGILYEMVSDVAVWVPVTFFLVWSGKGRGRSWGITVAAAALLEFLQLFVYSRVTDVNDVLMAGLGGWAGVLLAGRRLDASRAPAGRERVLLFWGGSVVLWSTVIMAVFWYPFDFRPERRFVMERIAMFHKVPFHALYYGSEFHAVTEVVRKTFFFAPLGACVAGIAHAFRSRLAESVGWGGAILVSGAVAVTVEVGQLALPGHYPDSTDILIGCTSGALGYGLARFVLRRTGHSAGDSCQLREPRRNP